MSWLRDAHDFANAAARKAERTTSRPFHDCVCGRMRKLGATEPWSCGPECKPGAYHGIEPPAGSIGHPNRQTPNTRY